MEKINGYIPSIVSVAMVLITLLNFWASGRNRKATVQQLESDAMAKQAESYSKQINDLRTSYDRAIVRIEKLEEDRDSREKEYERRISELETELHETRILLSEANQREDLLQKRVTELEKQVDGLNNTKE